MGDEWDEGGADGGWGEDANQSSNWETENDAGPAAGGMETEEMTVDQQIANAFYEAEDSKRERRKDALDKFKAVVELGKGKSINDDSKTSIFKSLTHMTVLLFADKKIDETMKQYKALLSMVPTVTRNEASEAVDTVLNTLSQSGDFKVQEEFYNVTTESLKSKPDAEKMIFSVNMKLCRQYVERKMYAEASKMLARLHKMCTNPDGTDDKKDKGSELLEIYAMEVKMSMAQHNSLKQKELYDNTKDLTAAVKDPRSQSIIRECWGQMFGDDGQWQRAYAEFFSAFTYYQEAGNGTKAKQCLKYVIVANMLSNGEQNPFDAREAKVYQKDPEIQVIGQLRQAYEKCDVQGFAVALDEINKTADDYIKTHMQSMIRDFQARAIVQLVKSYRRIRISYLGEQLKITPADVEAILVQLILDGEVSGRIDQVQGILDLTQRTEGGGKKYNAIDQWTNSLQILTTHMVNPATGGGGGMRMPY